MPKKTNKDVGKTSITDSPTGQIGRNGEIHLGCSSDSTATLAGCVGIDNLNHRPTEEPGLKAVTFGGLQGFIVAGAPYRGRSWRR